MRPFLPIFFLLLACSEQSSQPPDQPEAVATGVFAGKGRDRLCIANEASGSHVGIVTYGDGDNSCTLKGNVTQAEHGMLVEAMGDPACKLLVESNGETLISRVPDPKACEYYCGPGATMADRSFRRDSSASPAVDFAGDPLC